MPLAAPIAAALTDHAAHPFTLIVGGQDVTRQPGVLGVGVDPSSITIVENGPGAVSSMDFEIDDPRAELVITEQMRVEHTSTATDTINFAGFVDHWDVVVLSGAGGRRYRINAVGLETWLDWLIVPDAYTFTTSTPRLDRAVATLGGRSGILAIGVNGTANGSAALPVGTLQHPFTGSPPEIKNSLLPLTIAAGTTLRSAIDMLAAASQWQEATPLNWPPQGLHPVDYLATVDFYGRLRLWMDVDGQQPDDYATLAIVDTYVGANVGADVTYTVDGSTAVREAYIRGAGGTTYTLWVADGTGIKGRQVSYLDPDVTSGIGPGSNGQFVYDAQNLLESSVVRGTVRIEDWTPPATCHAGGLVSITDTGLGLATTYRIGSITKTFNDAGLQTWTITFGGLPPAASRLLRSLIG